MKPMNQKELELIVNRLCCIVEYLANNVGISSDELTSLIEGADIKQFADHRVDLPIEYMKKQGPKLSVVK